MDLTDPLKEFRQVHARISIIEKKKRKYWNKLIALQNQNSLHRKLHNFQQEGAGQVKKICIYINMCLRMLQLLYKKRVLKLQQTAKQKYLQAGLSQLAYTTEQSQVESSPAGKQKNWTTSTKRNKLHDYRTRALINSSHFPIFIGDKRFQIYLITGIALLNGLNLGLQRSHGHSRFHLPTTTTSYTNLSTTKETYLRNLLQ